MKTVAISGATGLLGRAILNVFSSNFNVIGTGFSRATAPLISLDLHDNDAVIEFLDRYSPDVFVHAAAERKPDICEHDHTTTTQLNVDVTESLARLCLERKIQFFFISTDYVFDGKNAPYCENSTTSPLNFYGQSKVKAENAVLGTSSEHSVIRVPVLYGDVEYLSESAVTIIAEQLIHSDRSEHDNWAIRYPTHVEDIALTLRDLVNAGPDNCGGVFHVSDSYKLTKYQIAQTIVNELSLKNKQLIPLAEPSQSASRPYNCSLLDTRLKTLGITHSRPFNDAIKQILIKHLA